MIFYAFDLLYLGGFDIRAAPLVDRRHVLAELLGTGVGNIVSSAHTEGDGNAIFKHACAMGLGVGLQAARRPVPLRQERDVAEGECVERETFTIVGFSPASESVASLHLAKRESKKLVYVGKAGTGFTRKVAHDLYWLLHPLTVAKPALAVPGRHPGTVRLRPDYEADIEYRAITGDGVLRHAAFKGLRAKER